MRTDGQTRLLTSLPCARRPAFGAILLQLAVLAPQFACAQAAPTITLADSIEAVLRRDNDADRLHDDKLKSAASQVQAAAGHF
jgi:hypothetical protein